MTLSGDEGAKKAAGIIQAAFDNKEKVEAMYNEFRSAKTVDDKEAKLKELETLDSGYYQIPGMKLSLLELRKDWSGLATGLIEMPNSQTKTSYLTNLVRKVEKRGAGGYSPELIKAVATKYTDCLLYTSPSPRDKRQSRMPSSA